MPSETAAADTCSEAAAAGHRAGTRRGHEVLELAERHRGWHKQILIKRHEFTLYTIQDPAILDVWPRTRCRRRGAARQAVPGRVRAAARRRVRSVPLAVPRRPLRLLRAGAGRASRCSTAPRSITGWSPVRRRERVSCATPRRSRRTTCRIRSRRGRPTPSNGSPPHDFGLRPNLSNNDAPSHTMVRELPARRVQPAAGRLARAARHAPGRRPRSTASSRGCAPARSSTSSRRCSATFPPRCCSSSSASPTPTSSG